MCAGPFFSRTGNIRKNRFLMVFDDVLGGIGYIHGHRICWFFKGIELGLEKGRPHEMAVSALPIYDV